MSVATQTLANHVNGVVILLSWENKRYNEKGKENTSGGEQEAKKYSFFNFDIKA